MPAGGDDGVLVIGSGPVGQTTALLLARRGVPVVLLDGRPERDLTGSRSICQQRDVLDVWESVGAGRRIADEGVTWTTARTFHQGRELFALTLGEGSSAFPPFVNLSQARTEQILDERIADSSLIEVRWGHEVVGLTQDADGVAVTCGNGRVFRRTHAVLCAGAHAGPLRRALGVEFAGRSFDDRFLICDIRVDLPGRATERRFHFDPVWNPGRQVLIHPCPGGTFRVDWQVPADFDPESDLDARIRAIVGDRPYEVVWRSVYRFQSRIADRMRVGRVLLAGDSAHLMAPFGARGLNSGVGDAENAAWKLALVRDGLAGEGLLESYHAERHAAALENLAVTTATMDFLVPHTDEQRRHRHDVLSRAGTDPEARAQVDSGRLYEPFWYVGSPLTTPDPERPFAGRPPRGQAPPPGPGVLLPDVPLDGGARLRELARDGFLLLTAPDGAPVPDLSADLGGLCVRTPDLSKIDTGGAVARALAIRSGEIWVIRPDAHIAAVLADPDRPDLVRALRRALGDHPSTARKGDDDGVLPARR